MLLAADIGNSNIVWGLFDGKTLKAHWRLATDSSKTSDDYAVTFLGLLETAGFRADQVSGVILSSVVPSLTPAFETLSEQHFHHTPLVVTFDMPTGLRLRYRNPQEIGSDRLVNAVAAYERYRTDLIIIDFGTATTFCAVTASGDYLGGAIAPGLNISVEALASRTAKLPKVALTRPKSVIGVDTVSSIQSGLMFGYVGLVDELVLRMERELGSKSKVLATGGLASLIAQESRTIQHVHPLLTLEGLEILYRKSTGDP